MVSKSQLGPPGCSPMDLVSGDPPSSSTACFCSPCWQSFLWALAQGVMPPELLQPHTARTKPQLRSLLAAKQAWAAGASVPLHQHCGLATNEVITAYKGDN